MPEMYGHCLARGILATPSDCRPVVALLTCEIGEKEVPLVVWVAAAILTYELLHELSLFSRAKPSCPVAIAHLWGELQCPQLCSKWTQDKQTLPHRDQKSDESDRWRRIPNHSSPTTNSKLKEPPSFQTEYTSNRYVSLPINQGFPHDEHLPVVVSIKKYPGTYPSLHKATAERTGRESRVLVVLFFGYKGREGLPNKGILYLCVNKITWCIFPSPPLLNYPSVRRREEKKPIINIQLRKALRSTVIKLCLVVRHLLSGSAPSTS